MFRLPADELRMEAEITGQGNWGCYTSQLAEAERDTETYCTSQREEAETETETETYCTSQREEAETETETFYTSQLEEVRCWSLIKDPMSNFR